MTEEKKTLIRLLVAHLKECAAGYKITGLDVFLRNGEEIKKEIIKICERKGEENNVKTKNS